MKEALTYRKYEITSRQSISYRLVFNWIEKFMDLIGITDLIIDKRALNK